MSISRKEFLRESVILGLSAVISPLKEFKFNDWDKGLDGKTVWEARRMSVLIKALGTNDTVHKIDLNGVDFQVFRPFLGKTEMVVREEDFGNFSGIIKKVRAQEVFGVMPTVTGFSGKYIADLGYIFDDGRKWDYYAKPFQEGNVLATYLAVDRYYDNKIVNATTAVLALAETMSEKPIASGEEFSYLEAAKIGELESVRGKILMGMGLTTGEEGKSKLVRMFGGGICVSVATIAKMARQAEAKGLVKITKRQSHGKDSSWWYFMNPDDPTVPQVDATAYLQTRTDFKFRNLAKEPLYIAPKVQIIPDQASLPEGYNGLEHSTAFFVLSVSLRREPVAKEEVLRIKSQLQEFRRIRGI